MTMSPVLVARDGGDHFHFLNTLQTAKLNSEQTNGALTAVEFYAPKNFGPPLPNTKNRFMPPISST